MMYVKTLMTQRNFAVLVILAVATAVLLPAVAGAQITPPTIPGGGNPIGITTLTGFVSQIFNFIIAIAGFFIVIFLLWGGIAYLTSGGNEEKKEAAKQRMITGVIGAAIILGVGVIIATISSVLGGTLQ